MEDDERREDEEQHRGQRVACAERDPQVLARQRGDVGEVRHASASRPVASGSSARRIVRGDDERPRAGELAELAVEKRRALLVEAGVRLVEDEELGLVEQRAAEREPLRHPARVRSHPFAAGLPQPEALEQHADPLASLRHAVEPPEEVEVLERR